MEGLQLGEEKVMEGSEVTVIDVAVTQKLGEMQMNVQGRRLSADVGGSTWLLMEGGRRLNP